MMAARGRRAQPGLLHGLGEFLLVKGLARRLHGREQRAFGEALGRTRPLFQRFHINHVLELALLEIRGENLLGRLLFPGPLFLLFRRGRNVKHLPAHLLDGRAGRVITIDALALGDSRDHGGYRPDVVVVPGAEQAPADEVIDLALLSGQAGALRRNSGRDYGVMVRDLGVVHKAPPERALAGAGRKLLAIGPFDHAHNARQCAGHVLRQVAAVGPRIADQLVALI